MTVLMLTKETTRQGIHYHNHGHRQQS